MTAYELSSLEMLSGHSWRSVVGPEGDISPLARVARAPDIHKWQAGPEVPYKGLNGSHNRRWRRRLVLVHYKQPGSGS